MSGLRFEIDTKATAIRKTLARFTDLNPDLLLDPIGALVVSQTQRRIDTEKAGPDGTPWEPNSQGSEILVESGALRDTIDYEVGGSSVEVGSPLIYAPVQHFGATIVPRQAQSLVFSIGGRLTFAKKVTIPARPFLGLSPQNIAELNRLIEILIRRLVQ